MPFIAADLFCGAGGFSEGFRQAGFKISAALDIWPPAVVTHKKNHPETRVLMRDILRLDPMEIGPIDVLIGSPPCTEFSFANRGGSGDIEAGMRLVYRFLRFVYELQPQHWVMENVPRVHEFLPEEVPLRKLGVNKRGSLPIPVRVVLLSANYGAPQKRSRAFSGDFPLPVGTHFERPGPGQVRWRTLGDVLSVLPDPLRGPMRETVQDPMYDIEIPTPSVTDHFGDGLRLKPGEVRENRRSKESHSWYGRMAFPDSLDRPARTIMATNMRISRETIVVPAGARSYRRLSVREASSVQGFPITYQWWAPTEGLRHMLVGNAVAPPTAFAIAQAISTAHRVDPIATPYVVRRVTDASPTAAPGVARPRKKRLFRRFREHVLRLPGHRVDLDNRGTTPAPHPGWVVRGRHPRHLARWRAVHYRGSGKGLSQQELSFARALRVFVASFSDPRSADRGSRFIAELDQMGSQVPDASTLQATWAGTLSGGNGPDVLLTRIADVVRRHYRDSGPILIHRAPARGFVPEPVAAALLATAYAVELANRSGGWVVSHRSQAYRPIGSTADRTIRGVPHVRQGFERLMRRGQRRGDARTPTRAALAR